MNSFITIDNNLPLFLQVKSYILKELKAMNLKNGDKIPSENAFCDQSTVSIRTVRRALAELEKAGVIVRRQGLGSFLCDLDAETKPVFLGTIGILFSDMSYVAHPVFSQLLQAIENHVLDQGYSFHLYSTGDRLAVGQKRLLEQIIPLDKVDGLIATSALQKEDIQTIRRNKIPFVAFNEYRNIQVNSVIIDYYSFARKGLEYLWNAGYQNIAFICKRFSKPGNAVIFNNDNFLRGIKDAFTEKKLIFNNKMVFQTDASRKQGWKIADSLLKSTTPPDAIFTVDELLAQGVCDAVEDNNTSCFVLGCGVSDENSSISKIKIPSTEWGQKAADLLFNAIKGDMSIKKTKMIKPELLVRKMKILKAI